MSTVAELGEYLAFVRFLVRVQREPAILLDGSKGNVFEQAFFDGLIGLWRSEHEAGFCRETVLRLAMAKPLALYVETHYEDESAPEVAPFLEWIREYRESQSPEAMAVRTSHVHWLAQESILNRELRAYLNLLHEARSVVRDIEVPGRATPENDENDAEHSVQLALAAVYLAATSLKGLCLDQSALMVDALIHDLVEGVAGVGDTSARGTPDLLAGKDEREEMGFRIIDRQFPWLGRLIRRYESLCNPEGSVIKGLDKVMPIAMIGLAGGGKWIKDGGFSYEWQLERLRAKRAGPIFCALGGEVAAFWLVRFCTGAPI